MTTYPEYMDWGALTINALVKANPDITLAREAGYKELTETRMNELIKDGVNVNYRCSIHYSPLHHAYAKGRINNIELLAMRGADVNHKKENGETLLFDARLDSARALLKNGADINIRRNDGNTALHCAFEKMEYIYAGFLLENGANPDIKNNNGEIAIDILNTDRHPRKEIQIFKRKIKSNIVTLTDNDISSEIAKKIMKKKVWLVKGNIKNIKEMYPTIGKNYEFSSQSIESVIVTLIQKCDIKIYKEIIRDAVVWTNIFNLLLSIVNAANENNIIYYTEKKELLDKVLNEFDAA